MYCETDKQVTGIEKRREKNDDMLKLLDKRNLELTGPKEKYCDRI